MTSKRPPVTRAEVFREVRQQLGLVPGWLEAMPEGALQGFWVMSRDFWLAESAVPNKYKELIGVAVAGATRCRYCAYFHTEAARLFGATDAEIADAAMMSGLSMAGSTFINASQIDYQEFCHETQKMIDHVKRNH